MLASLTVQNFAIISNINIEFDKGLTILTGETGAGKSLIIDAIGLLFGNRASTSMIRSGCTKAIVEGVFIDCGSKVMDIIKKYDLDSLDEGVIVVRREINENGKSLIRVNGAVVTLNQLSEITYYLADIHTQLDTKKLFDVHNYVNFIDDTTSLEILDEYHNRLNLYKNNLKLYYDKKNQIEADAENLDYLKYQLNELNSASLVANELEEIENKIKELNNYEHIYKGLSSVKNAFSDNDIVGSLYLVKQNLAKLKDLSDSYQNIFETSENLYYELEALEEDVIAKCSNLEFDEKTLDKLNSRYSFIKELMRKHRKSFDELIEYQNELNERVNNFEKNDILLEDYYKNVVSSYNNLKEVTSLLTNIRMKNAKKLKDNILETLKSLYLEKVQLDIKFNEYTFKNELDDAIFKEDGADLVSFYISFNVGEPLKDLSKVASGGEMSRVMLAFKVHLLKNLGLFWVYQDIN